MSFFSESSYDYESEENIENTQVKVSKNNSIRDFISSILFTCSGETTQYEETITALENSLICYLRHLSHESIKYAKNPQKICSEDIISALKEYQPLQNNVISFLDDMKSINKSTKT